jgi:hypothetical protein
MAVKSNFKTTVRMEDRDAAKTFLRNVICFICFRHFYFETCDDVARPQGIPAERYKQAAKGSYLKMPASFLPQKKYSENEYQILSEMEEGCKFQTVLWKSNYCEDAANKKASLSIKL